MFCNLIKNLRRLPELSKNLIRHTFVYGIINYIRHKKKLQEWEKKGKPIPPPHIVKEIIIKEYAKKFSVEIFVETGTYLGDMVYATKNTFSRIFSIELDKAIYERAKKKFSRFEHISIIQGDSAKVLPDILIGIDQPCIFWLDGHYSGGITAKGKSETPVIQELYCILSRSVAGDVILIDDARLFSSQSDYPTIEELRNLIFKRQPDWVFEVKNDIIRIHKKQAD